MAAEAIAVEQTTATRADLQESEGRLSREIRDSEARLHRELEHYATKANLKDTELRVLTKLQEVQVELQGQIKDAQMWLLLRLGGLIVASVTVAVAVLKLLS